MSLCNSGADGTVRMGEDGGVVYCMRLHPDMSVRDFFMADMTDITYMQRALDLAEKGRGTTRPNPLVGAVIVKDNRIVGEGYHEKAGSPHAEIAALTDAGNSVRGADLYVTLEPCCHTGRTGPCTDEIVKAGIKRVVFAVRDTDPRVMGRGEQRLRDADIDVTSGVLEHEALRQNDIFFHYTQHKTPFVIVKSAQTLDGRIATCTGDSKWISGEAARTIAHRLRAEVDAVVVGGATVRSDDPALTVRHLPGDDPHRIVVSSSLELPSDAALLNNDDGKTILASGERSIERFRQRHANTDHLTFWPLKTENDQLSLSDLIAHMTEAKMHAVLVEGGSMLLTGFVRQRLAHKYVQFIAPKLVGSGVNGIGDLGIASIGEAVSFVEPRFETVGEDMMFTGYLKKAN